MLILILKGYILYASNIWHLEKSKLWKWGKISDSQDIVSRETVNQQVIVLIILFVAMPKFPTKSNFSKEGLTWVHSLRVECIKGGKAWVQKLERAGHITHRQEAERETSAGAQFPCPLLNQGIAPPTLKASLFT